MTTSAGTGPADVKKELDTDLADSDINDVLGLVENDIDRTYSSGTQDFEDATHRVEFEAALAALRIAVGNAGDAQDRVASETASGRTSITYDASTVAALRQRVRQRDPKSAFGTGAMLRRDTDRYSTSGTPGSNQ